MNFAPDFSPDRASNILRPKAWGKAFLQLSLHAHTLLSPRDFCFSFRELKAQMSNTLQCVSVQSQGCWNTSRAEKKHDSLRGDVLSAGWESSQERGLGYFKKDSQGPGPHQLFLMMKWKSPSSLDIGKLHCLQSKAQKKVGPVLVSRMSKVFSGENNSTLSRVEIQWKISWLCYPHIYISIYPSIYLSIYLHNPVILTLDSYL